MIFPDDFLGAIAAAFIAGLASILGLVITKEAKISEFRQAWIDGLRADLADLISHANVIHSALAIREGSTVDVWKGIKENYREINSSTASIRLRLNPGEDDAEKVLEYIERLEVLVDPINPAPSGEVKEMEKELVLVAQDLLKREWNRVKRGEILYRSIVLFLSAGVLFAAGVLFIGWLGGLYRNGNCPTPLPRRAVSYAAC